jgi:hypothetical protein
MIACLSCNSGTSTIGPQCDGVTSSGTFYQDDTCLYGQQSTDLGAAAASINCFASNASNFMPNLWDIQGITPVFDSSITSGGHGSESGESVQHCTCAHTHVQPILPSASMHTLALIASAHAMHTHVFTHIHTSHTTLPAHVQCMRVLVATSCRCRTRHRRRIICASLAWLRTSSTPPTSGRSPSCPLLARRQLAMAATTCKTLKSIRSLLRTCMPTSSTHEGG